jgi:putative autotransporter adhesin-like protein
MRFAVLILAVILLLCGCGGGPKVTQNRDVAAYTRLDVEDSVNVDVVPGDEQHVVVTGGKDVIDRVKTEVRDGALHVFVKDRGIVIGSDPFDGVRVEISSAGLEGIRVQAGGDLKLGRIDQDELDVGINGSGDLEASGTVSHLALAIEGSGDADLSELEARTARVTIEGSGDAAVNVIDELDVSIEGAGDVSYRGTPRVSQRVEGAGEVSAED